MGLESDPRESGDGGEWVDWLWAWENPHPEKNIAGFRFEPVQRRHRHSFRDHGGRCLLASPPMAGEAQGGSFPSGSSEFDPRLDDQGLLTQIRLDMGQVISASLRLSYPEDSWARGYNNALPEVSQREVVIEYAAHPEGRFHFEDGTTLPVADVEGKKSPGRLRPVAPAAQRVRIKVVEKGDGKPVAVKLHVHGEAGEYLAPMDRHRLPNDAWFEDFSVDFVHQGTHNCTYIPGETTVRLPAGKVFIEVSRGFEIRPVRQVVSISPETQEITVELEKVLPWRENGWVTADTHVHFLTPGSALLEGSGEGVNVVNLLSSQWGELMTNVG